MTDQDIHQFFEQEKNTIMANIYGQDKKKTCPLSFVRLGWIPVFLFVIVISLVFLIKPGPSNDRLVFQEQFLQIKDRLTDILEDSGMEELSLYTNESLVELSDSDLIFRQDLLDAYLNGDSNRVYDDYLEQLLTTKDFVVAVEDLVLNSSNWALGEEIIPDDNLDVTFTFLLSTGEYVVIKKRDGLRHSTIKLGMENDKLVYYELHYSYDLDTDFVSNEDSLNYNYFHFSEGEEAIFINSLTDLISLRYTSIIDESQFTIVKGNQVVEGLASTEGYSFNSFDSASNTTQYYQVVDDEIVSETFDVYSDYGLLYRYEDIDVTNDLINLSVNIVPALGWDYLYTDDSDDYLEGVYAEDGTALFTGHIYYVFQANYGYAAFKQTIDKSALANKDFKLTDYGMDLSDERASLDYLDSIRVSDFEEAKQAFDVEGIDFFSDNLKADLYNYIDQDVLTEITEEDDSEDIASGDVEAFENDMSDIDHAFSLQGQLVIESDVTFNYYDGDNLIESETVSQDTKYDIGDMYLERIFYSYNAFIGRDILIPYEGQLVLFSSEDGPITEFEIVSQSATPQDFLEYLISEFTELDLLEGIIHIDSQGSGIYKLSMNDDVFGEEINMDLVFQQMGINGLSDAQIEATYAFDQDHQSYDMVLTITGLRTIEGDYDVTYEEISHVSIQSFAKIDPLDSVIFFKLPQTKEDIIFDSQMNQLNVYYINEGQSWMRLYLEEGVYSSNIYGDSNSRLSYELRDEFGQIIDDQSYRFEIDSSGYYYYLFTSSVNQRIDTTITENPYPINQDVTMDSLSGLIELNSQSETDTYHLHTNVDDRERILRLTLNPITDGTLMINELDSDGDHIGNYMFEEYENIVYILIPASTQVDLEISGMYLGEFSFSYDYAYPPESGDSQVIYDLSSLDDFPHVIMNEHLTKVRYNFSIDQEDYYRFNKSINSFGEDVDIVMALFDSDGTRLATSHYFIAQNLQAGDYYIEFYYSDSNINLLILMPTAG